MGLGAEPPEEEDDVLTPEIMFWHNASMDPAALWRVPGAGRVVGWEILSVRMRNWWQARRTARARKG
jgi:hypothetical protein